MCEDKVMRENKVMRKDNIMRVNKWIILCVRAV